MDAGATTVHCRTRRPTPFLGNYSASPCTRLARFENFLAVVCTQSNLRESSPTDVVYIRFVVARLRRNVPVSSTVAFETDHAQFATS
mmetsp:Transcript_113017/g.319743  ORF Transcript_113017/g.319743 Transcript_113017/m.319743 type:complete len:87 (+) Transcript_113017:47-307(+)